MFLASRGEEVQLFLLRHKLLLFHSLEPIMLIHGLQTDSKGFFFLPPHNDLILFTACKNIVYKNYMDGHQRVATDVF